MKKSRQSPLIGFYDYTVILTYASVISALVGIFLSLTGKQQPFTSIFLLLFCGLCDAFDGRVARHKKNRTDAMRAFGVQIDSLSDLIAFGVFPACIGFSMWETLFERQGGFRLPGLLVLVISVLYVLGALIRLGYFNVTEEERQSKEDGVRKYYTGLPVTIASLIFPTVALLEAVIPGNNSWLYYGIMLLVAGCFVGNFQLRKPGFKAIVLMVAIGVLEAGIFLLFRYLSHG